MFLKSLVLMFGVVAVLVLSLSSLFPRDRIMEGTTGCSGNKEAHVVKVAWEDGSNAVIEFTDQIIDPKVARNISEQFSVLVRKLGKKHTKIVLDVPKASLEYFKLNVYSIVLKAVADENGNRERDGLKPIKVFIGVTSRSFMAGTVFSGSRFWLLVWLVALAIMVLRGNLD